MTTHSFPPSSRVLKRSEFMRFFNGSEVKKLGQCLVFRIPNTKGRARLGMTIKVKSGSVDRNKIKRQVREIFRQGAPNLGGHDYNVVVTGAMRTNHESPYRIRKLLERIWLNEPRF